MSRAPDEVFPPENWRLSGREFGNARERRRDARGGRVLGVLIYNIETAEEEVLLHPDLERHFSGAFLHGLFDGWRGLLAHEKSAWGELDRDALKPAEAAKIIEGARAETVVRLADWKRAKAVEADQE